MKNFRKYLPAVILFGIAALAILVVIGLLTRSAERVPVPALPSASAPVTEAPLATPEADPEPEPVSETPALPEPSPEPVQEYTPLSVEDLLVFEPSPLYATIWPVKNLPVYAGTDMEEEIGTAPAGGMYCVLGEDKEAALFRIRLAPDVYGYIDSNYCLIDLPDYIGPLCSYDITNSYSSLYAVHEFAIPGLTRNVITGYENVRLADGSFLVPFLYPCTEKLIAAAKEALGLGYRIRIYDAYRPRTATRAIYSTAMQVMPCALPSETYSGVAVSLPPVPEAEPGEVQRTWLIYQDLVELWGWDLGSFLAPGASRHNMGVAVDMTFEDAVTGEAVTAQTSIHDLSAYSTIRSNNEASALIYRTMQGHGLKNIVSEWWHFQDNDAMNNLKPPYCECELSAQGWISDARGERYRSADGTILANCVLVTPEGTFTIDTDGYRAD